MNHLEQLIAEWYEFQGYFVRRNVFVGKRAKGGYECELDIVAFHPEKRKLIQIEPSLDANSWAIREKRYKKKFQAGKKYIPKLFKGIDIPDKIEQQAVLLFASKANRTKLAGGEIVLVKEVLQEIVDAMTDPIAHKAVSQQFPLLRTIQFVTEFKDTLFVS